MAALADQRAATRHRPLRGVRCVRAAMRFLALHEQDLVAGRPQDFRDLADRRRVHPILSIQKQLPACPNGSAGLLHFLHHALIHLRLRHMRADWRLVVRTAEIAGEWLFADHVLAGPHAAHNHVRMQRRRRADVDHVDFGVGQQRAPVALCVRNAEAAGKLRHAVAERAYDAHLHVEAEHAAIGVHVQRGDETAADQAHSYSLHALTSLPRQSCIFQEGGRQHKSPYRSAQRAPTSCRRCDGRVDPSAARSAH